MADVLRPLVTLGPFMGGDWTTEPSFLDQGMAADCSNVDISANLSSFTIANGRTLVKSGIVPDGYYVDGSVMFTAVDGPNGVPQILPIRFLVYSATNPNGQTYTAIYNTATGNILNTTGTLLPFTKAVQFQDGIYTNAGQQIRIRQWAGPMSLDGLSFIISAWQPSRPLAQIFKSLTSTATSGPGAGTYSYAVALLIGRGSAFGLTNTGVDAPVYQDTTTQMTAPYFIPGSVTIADGSHAPVLTLNLPAAVFPAVNQGGDYTVTPVVFRSSINQPIYRQIPVSGVGGTITDTFTDASIAGNTSIESPSIGVPPPFTYLLEEGFPPTGATTPLTYYDYAFQSAAGFCANHKGRLWAFALYPNNWDWVAYNSDAAGAGALFDVLMQAQVWWSSVGVPWQFDGVDGVSVVGPEEVVGNVNISSLQLMPTINPMLWVPGQIEDTPMGMESIASELVLFKSNNFYKVWGDTGAEFTVYPVADIGTVASSSITPFEGGVGWLAPQGAQFYNGGPPSYIGENVRKLVEGLPFSLRENCVGFYRDRTWYLSFPNVQVVVPPTVQQQTVTGSNAGTANITAAGGSQTVSGAQETATINVVCRVTLHKPTPDPDTWFETWFCNAGATTAATWTVTCAAPVDAGHQVSFKPTDISGTSNANLQLIGPNGTVLQEWDDITNGVEIDYFNAAAIAGTYTWSILPDVSGQTGVQDDSTTGSYDVTVTPTLKYISGSGAQSVTNGASTTLTLATATPPVSSGTQISLTLSSVVVPSDANGTSNYVAILTDSSGNVWSSNLGLVAGQTINFFNPSAPPGTYTWTVFATVTPAGGGGTSTYSCSCSLSASWYQETGGSFATSGFTLSYYTPTKQWWKLPYAVNAACTSDFPDNLAYAFIDTNLYTFGTDAAGDDGASSVLATWTGNVSSGESPGLTKDYRYLVLDAPNTQTPTTVSLTITIDDGRLVSPFTATFDLSKGETAFVASIPGGSRGYVAQLSLSVNGEPGTIIRNAYALGTVVRDAWVNT